MANGTVQAKHHLHQQHPQVASKLKPVKERRPTALPTQQPKIENDADGTGGDGTRVAGVGQSAHFFIGNGEENEDDDDNSEEDEQYDEEYEDDKDVVVVRENDVNAGKALISASLNHKQLQQQQFADVVDVSGKHTSLKSSSSTSLAAKSSKASNSTSVTSITSKIRTKLPSNTSNKVRKFGRTDTASSQTNSQHQQQQQQEEDKVHIPPPPPLPPQPLCLPNSPSLSLVSKSKRNSNLPESQSPTATNSNAGAASGSTFEILTETDVKTQDSSSSLSSSSASSSPATHQQKSGNAKARVSQLFFLILGLHSSQALICRLGTELNRTEHALAFVEKSLSQILSPF